MRVATCDDNPLDRELLIDVLQEYFVEKSVHFKFFPYNNGENLLDAVTDGELFDLIFLDMYYIEAEHRAKENINGMDIARQLRQKGFNGNIIFLTGSADFVFQGYDVGAAAYLLKPHNAKKIYETIDRVLKPSDVDTFQIRQRSTIIRIPYNEILYVESSNSKCILHCLDGSKYTIYKRLSDIERELNNVCFLRCHQSYLVNMNYIQSADKSFKLTNGDTILIRQRELKRIRELYLNYIANKLK